VDPAARAWSRNVAGRLLGGRLGLLWAGEARGSMSKAREPSKPIYALCGVESGGQRSSSPRSVQTTLIGSRQANSRAPRSMKRHSPGFLG
jgi:hypothetical protein